MPMSAREWSKSEKSIAQQAFDRAYERECGELLNVVRGMLNQIAEPSDLWRAHDYLTDKRKELAEKYDYRYSVLIYVFARLIGEGWIGEDELDGLSEDKLAKIRFLAGTDDQR
jgi:Photoprotection regulator fluorescence recovery protein